ncbi:tRNA1(Val) (adenine(37)-N6)-methyltransferase [Winogradskyella sediminis]|uniref:tRNA1(Val) (adenine(37)-N6)-methyltransferase n=1 Tax=Winogradskyella sediminis TaxID=1382466 RepID=UPI000E249537|nr:methyltransferase [Winogradskyella sediminis]REG89720.1 tRNA1Val (adenine37-N6)-methyltransferase [Winogradskyella sediminis]
MNKPFKFKQFTVLQDQCAMKIGTDSVLLGAWTSVEHHPHNILDIGSGTGVLSLMLAQRCFAENIEAIEIDNEAYEQCAENFENSPWADRLFCYHAGMIEFVEEVEDKYDLIICNPPFYSEDYKTEDSSRNLARFNDAMPFEHLIYAVVNLLSRTGIFSVVIPFNEEANLIHLALKLGLFPNRILHVKGNVDSDIKRSLIEFSFDDTESKTSKLIIETARHQYTDDYINLTKDFYLKM